MKNTYTTIESFSYRNHNYRITMIDGMYCAIDEKYIGKNGKILKVLNGLEMHASRDIENCKTAIRNDLDLEYYQSHGMSKAEAFCKVFPDMDLAVAKQVFGE